MVKTLKESAVSWKTTTVGILMFVGALSAALVAQWDENVTTVPDWNNVYLAFSAMILSLFIQDGGADDRKTGIPKPRRSFGQKR